MPVNGRAIEMASLFDSTCDTFTHIKSMQAFRAGKQNEL